MQCRDSWYMPTIYPLISNLRFINMNFWEWTVLWVPVLKTFTKLAFLFETNTMSSNRVHFKNVVGSKILISYNSVIFHLIQTIIGSFSLEILSSIPIWRQIWAQLGNSGEIDPKFVQIRWKLTQLCFFPPALNWQVFSFRSHSRKCHEHCSFELRSYNTGCDQSTVLWNVKTAQQPALKELHEL